MTKHFPFGGFLSRTAPILRWILLVFSIAPAFSLLAQPNASPSAPSVPAPPPPRSRVVIVEDPSLVFQFQINETAAARAFNNALLALTQKSSIREAWLSLVSPSDVVGVKISTAGARYGATRSVVMSVLEGLQAAGIPAGNIILWDRFDYNMISAGYPPGPRRGWQIRSVVPGAGFDSAKFYFNEVVGQLIWSDLDFKGRKQVTLQNLIEQATPKTGNFTDPDAPKGPIQISNRSYFTRIVTQQTTKIVNIAAMTDQAEIGINGCLASLALASVDNSRRFADEKTSGDPAIAEILAHDVFAGKVVLNVMDGLIAQYAGGPTFTPHYANQAGLLFLSKDPVAIDTIALERIEQWRKDKKVVAIGESGKHVAGCAAYGLGTNKKSNMDILMVRP